MISEAPSVRISPSCAVIAPVYSQNSVLSCEGAARRSDADTASTPAIALSAGESTGFRSLRRRSFRAGNRSTASRSRGARYILSDSIPPPASESLCLRTQYSTLSDGMRQPVGQLRRGSLSAVSLQDRDLIVTATQAPSNYCGRSRAAAPPPGWGAPAQFRGNRDDARRSRLRRERELAEPACQPSVWRKEPKGDFFGRPFVVPPARGTKATLRQGRGPALTFEIESEASAKRALSAEVAALG